MLIVAVLVGALFSSFCLPYAAAQDTTEHVTVINEALDDYDPDRIRPVSDDRLDHALSIFKSDESLQRERPESEPEPFVPRKPPGPFARWLASVFRFFGPIIGYILIVVLVLAALAALYFIFGESLTLRGKQKEEKVKPVISQMPDLRPEEETARALLEDADALAAAGRFAEAVHLLLFRSINDIQEKQQGSVPRSMTAREIGRLETLPSRVRSALSPIIQIVERSFFGGREVDEGGWQSARKSYESFAFGEAWA